MADRDILGDRLHVIDVSYEDIRAGCLGVIRGIWASRGRTLPATEEAAITTWDAGNPRHRFGRHTYSLDRYGITGADVRAAFEVYLSRFPAG